MIDDTGTEIQTLTDSVEAQNLYANEEKAVEEQSHIHAQRGDSADEVDPRRLVRDPTMSEIRWYYRRTFAKVLVDKPIDDAFKNGFDFHGDTEDEARSLIEDPTFDGEGEGFVGAYRMAEKKARRDGFALIFIGTEERGTDGIHMSPISEDVEVRNITHLKVLTIDDLSQTAPHEQIEEGTGLDEEDYRVRETGIVINTDANSADFKTPVGYVLGGTNPQFIHADRVLHYTWNPEVDGDYKGNGVKRWNDRTDTLGQYEGDSVLIPTYNLLKGISKGNWAVMQSIFRNASHVYSVKLPPDADDEDFSNAVDATRSVNAKSAYVWPSNDYEFEQHTSGNTMEPREHYDVLFDQVCAGHEMTKSVLFGTQTGTVSGSEVDIKNYFNKIERYRSNRAESKIEEYLTRAKRIEDGRTSPEYAFDIEIEWGPLFKVDRETRIQILQNQSNALSTLVGSYMLTPDEARELLTEDFTSVDLDDMTESQMDVLDRINLSRYGQGQQALASEGEYTNSPSSEAARSTAAASQGGQSGGMEQGQTTSSQNPAADSADATQALADHMLSTMDARQGAYIETPAGRGLVFDTKDGEFQFGPDGETVTPERSSVLVVALEDGGAAAVETDPDGGYTVHAETGQNVDHDLPSGWDRSSLLDWWDSVGADFEDAKDELVSERDITADQANQIAARMKDMALGHTEWRGDNGY